MEKRVPGTEVAFEKENAFESFKKIIELTDGLSLGQVCSITGLDQFVIQNWVKRGYVARPVKKKYYEKHLARILLINSLKDSMKIEEIGKLMTLVNGDVDDESDDLLSEVELYDLFTRAIYHMKSSESIEDSIRELLKSVNMNDDKLFTALEVMVYGYIAGVHKKISNRYLEVLETY